jgi:anaphase-promoting complex subunit 3
VGTGDGGEGTLRETGVCFCTWRSSFRLDYVEVPYLQAERAFKTVRMLEPYRLWDMEVYSTLLWHLQRNVQLSFLAQELLNINPQSAQAWIAVGNLFSLQKDRLQALTCFRRAVLMDSSCAYAYTLSGHESIDDDLEKAINFFQSALRADPRHYNAWWEFSSMCGFLCSLFSRYGLGTCYLRLSKIRLAEYHFRKAVEIHPNNAVLLGCVGMVGLFCSVDTHADDLQAVERRGDREAALGLFDEAIELAPENALVRYRRAKILIALKKYEVWIEWCGDEAVLTFGISSRSKTWKGCETRRRKNRTWCSSWRRRTDWWAMR